MLRKEIYAVSVRGDCFPRQWGRILVVQNRERNPAPVRPDEIHASCVDDICAWRRRRYPAVGRTWWTTGPATRLCGYAATPRPALAARAPGVDSCQGKRSPRFERIWGFIILDFGYISRHGTLVPKGGAFPNECGIAGLRTIGKTKSGSRAAGRYPRLGRGRYLHLRCRRYPALRAGL